MSSQQLTNLQGRPRRSDGLWTADAILRALIAAGEPMTCYTLPAVVGRGRQCCRSHLRALADSGYVTALGRGRYIASPEGYARIGAEAAAMYGHIDA